MSLVDWTCPACGREIRVDANRTSCFCNACGRRIETPVKGHKRIANAMPGGNAEDPADSQPPRQPAAEATPIMLSKPSIGKVIGCVILCDFIMSFCMGIISISVFRDMGYSAYLGPSLLTLFFSVLLGTYYRATGKMVLPILLSAVIGIAAGLLLPYVGIATMQLRYGK